MLEEFTTKRRNRKPALAFEERAMKRHGRPRAIVADRRSEAMIVCMSLRICAILYDEIIKLCPAWHSDDDESGVLKIVMTGAASDAKEKEPHIGSKARPELLAKRAKDPNEALNLAIVRDMWLTGFDAPSMHTINIDKPMRTI